MAGFSIIKSALPLLMLMASCYCASYSFGGTFGVVSDLKLTSTGFGTMKSNKTANSGIGGIWNGTVYGGGYGNYDKLNAGAVGSANKVVSLKPGDGFGDIENNDTVYRGKVFFGEKARKLSHPIMEGDVSVIRDDDTNRASTDVSIDDFTDVSSE